MRSSTESIEDGGAVVTTLRFEAKDFASNLKRLPAVGRKRSSNEVIFELGGLTWLNLNRGL
jgi:hypothetical protein